MEKYLEKFKSLGADSSKIIDPKTIKTAAWVAYKCQFGCPMYGKKRCCPPFTPTWQQTQKMIDDFTLAVLFSAADMKLTSDIAVTMSRELFLDGFYKVVAFGSGNCKICQTCNLDRCNFPQKAIPSMEACGIDVFYTVRQNGYEIATLTDKTQAAHYFGMLLVE